MRFLRKSRETEWGFKGEITAFSALIFVLVISIVGALVESASIQVAMIMKRSATRLALESFFAEYHVEMLKKYDLFVRVTGNEKVVQKRLQYYGANGVEHTLEKEQLLTDHRGKPFFEQAVLYARDWIGLEDTSFADILFETDIEHQENSILKKLEDVLDTKENPLQFVQDLKNRGVLTLVLPKGSSAICSRIAFRKLWRRKRERHYGQNAFCNVSCRTFFEFSKE